MHTQPQTHIQKRGESLLQETQSSLKTDSTRAMHFYIVSRPTNTSAAFVSSSRTYGEGHPLPGTVLASLQTEAPLCMRGKREKPSGATRTRSRVTRAATCPARSWKGLPEKSIKRRHRHSLISYSRRKQKHSFFYNGAPLQQFASTCVEANKN